jgi:hypothetical protein
MLTDLGIIQSFVMLGSTVALIVDRDNIELILGCAVGLTAAIMALALLLYFFW